MVLDKLGSVLKDSLKKIAKAVFVDEKVVNELIRDIQRALIAGDVNVKLVFDLTQNIKKRFLEERPKNINEREYLVKVVYDELVRFLGGEEEEIKIDKKKKPFQIMFVGLYGSGKTTTIGKLAHYYQKRGFKVGVLGLDVHRPAAIDQLEQLAKQVNVDCYTKRDEKDVIKIYNEFKNDFSKYDVLLIDTAGRDALSDELIKEITNLYNKVKPDENLLVVSADIGQAAKEQAQKFHDSGKITGVIITKLDGTAKGGGALSACSVTGAKIKFVGVGEKINDIERFNPKGFVSRLLGMGDLEALLEKVKVEISEETAEDLGKKFLKGDFNFLDLYEQMQNMGKLGPLSKIMEMIPGMGNIKIPKDMLDVQEEKLKKWKHIMQSMSKEELEDPDILTRARIDRVAKGAGVTVGEVRELLKQYRQSKKLMKMMKGKDPEKLMRKFKGNIKI